MLHHYPAILHKDPTSDYGVSFPDFPGCVAVGENVEEALTEAAAALALHVSGMAEDGEPFPEPTPLEAAKREAEPEGLWALALVAVALPPRSQRYNVMLPEDLVAKIDAISPNRSAFIAESIRTRLARETPKPAKAPRKRLKAKTAKRKAPATQKRAPNRSVQSVSKRA